MYFPYLRGRQFELIALRELIEKNLISPKIIPIIEPVKRSSSLLKTLSIYNQYKKEIALINNPQVGTFIKKQNPEDSENTEKFDSNLENLKSDNYIIDSYFLCEEIASRLNSKDIYNKTIILANNHDSLDVYPKIFQDSYPRFSLIIDESEFRREIRKNRVLIADRFKKQPRNTDYLNNEDEPFSSDHLFYKDDGYVGFSDYSIIGDEYSESGFAPFAVAIHILYFDDKQKLRVRHFVSDTNDDYTDPVGKFKEAVTKLVEWNETMQLSTFAIKKFEEMYKEESYPGLGTVKKLSIMHHLELINIYLEKEG
jgi:hypothetical protein